MEVEDVLVEVFRGLQFEIEHIVAVRLTVAVRVATVQQVGRDADQPSRLFVDRVAALSSRSASANPDTATVALGAVDAATLVSRLASCRAVVFPAFEEDYGLVTVEAFASGKAVITCRDSGGPAELVRDGETGLVCDPTPASLAAGTSPPSPTRARK